ncbi:MAG: TIGR03854 family LLM class F420-dependent oxidoreductase [Acidimicrobiales bacterium]
MKVRIGYGLGTQHAAVQLAHLIDELERLHFDSLWLSERITGAAPDPLVGLAFAAGRTTRLKLGTSVLVLPGRNPALLAKELASLDVLSGGRLLPAFGLGVANPEEQQAFGVAREARAKWFDEAIEVIRKFWEGDPVDHDGELFHYEALRVQPRPAQSPPDIWMGGIAPSELRRVGRLADGWLPSFITPDEARAGRERIEEVAAQSGRHIDDEHFGALIPYVHTEIPDRFRTALHARRPGVDPEDILPVGVTAVRELLGRFVSAGFSKFVLVPVVEPADWTAELEELASQVLPMESPAWS